MQIPGDRAAPAVAQRLRTARIVGLQEGPLDEAADRLITGRRAVQHPIVAIAERRAANTRNSATVFHGHELFAPAAGRRLAITPRVDILAVHGPEKRDVEHAVVTAADDTDRQLRPVLDLQHHLVNVQPTRRVAPRPVEAVMPMGIP